MEKFIIQGGTPLRGTVAVGGAKNAALPLMAAALALRGTTVLRNVPELVDVRTLLGLLESLGVRSQRRTDGSMELEVTDESPHVAEYELVRRMRAGVCVLGPLLARRGRGVVSLPGGCNIGHRPVDLHLRGLAALGAEIDVRNGYIHAHAKVLRGARIFLGGPHGSTVTGTCNVMTAAALARGVTIIESAACEPEVVALAEFLNQAGARITGQGSPHIEIRGVKEMQAVEFENIPDRIEAATLLIAASATGGEITLTGARSDHLTAVLQTLSEMGADIAILSGGDRQVTQIQIRPTGRLRPVQFSALPYPGVPTDVQAQLLAGLCTVPGHSIVRDCVFPERFMHVSELCRMGAQITQQGNAALITGVPRLSGASVMASDLRASAALVIAGLCAEGETHLHRVYHLDRGYEKLELKLASLGASVLRLDERAVPVESRQAA